MITRQAPAWAWDIIDETLAIDAQSRAFDPHLRNAIGDALAAMREPDSITIGELIARLKTLPQNATIGDTF